MLSSDDSCPIVRSGDLFTGEAVCSGRLAVIEDTDTRHSVDNILLCMDCGAVWSMDSK